MVVTTTPSLLNLTLLIYISHFMTQHTSLRPPSVAILVQQHYKLFRISQKCHIIYSFYDSFFFNLFFIQLNHFLIIKIVLQFTNGNDISQSICFNLITNWYSRLLPKRHSMSQLQQNFSTNFPP